MDAIGQSNFLQALGWAVLNSLWQMALLWVVYQAITGIFSRTNPTQKSILASSLLFTGFAWFVFTFISIFLNQRVDETIVAASFTSVQGNPQLNEWLDSTLPLASMIYLLLLILPLLHFARNYRFVQLIRNHGISKADVEWRIFVKNVAERIGIRKPVKIWVSELVSSPVTIGFLKPIILVPLAAVNHLSPQQLEAVLLHELAHIRRYDYLMNLIIKFIQSILYFNPFVKAFVAIVEREREKSCDEMVIQFQYDPHGYASALLVLEKANHFAGTLAVAAGGRKHDLLHRVEWIMGVKKKPVVTFNKLAGLFAGLLCIIVLNALLILSKPGKANNSLAGSIASLSSPLYFFSDNEEGLPLVEESRITAEVLEAVTVTEMKTTIRNKAKTVASKKAKPKIDMEALAEKINYYTANPYAATVAYMDQPSIPQLTQYEEQQVKGAISASKKVVEEGQWRKMEKDIAEALTQQQKEQLKTVYKTEMNKVDWEKWENKLRLAYDQINWEKVNLQLDLAVQNIQLDSLNHAYSIALNNLNVLQNELKELNISSIPDTDISVKSVEARKKEVQKAINVIRAVRNRKIVHL